MNNDELIEYAIRTSNAIKEEMKPKLIDYFYKQKKVINRAVKYIENEMPYLQEIDNEYEDINGNTYFTYKEYDGKELLDILKGVENE